ncbi:glucose 1-dehydrogenase [Paenibacillus sp. YYML68]|uniref:glucose 1-dehydrogenase n=1 Tax=Paenibacillus sp. YYML68 TaxID=2909250 RepID=UPI0024918E13|nr:glucose 1-dehydrogenase [Paenibacillus sp. YYML68]
MSDRMKAVRVTGLTDPLDHREDDAASGALRLKPMLELAEVPRPKRVSKTDVLVRVLCVGMDGTDREIVSEQYGVPPLGEHSLILGHESLGVVMEADAATGLKPGDAVTALVRRPCGQPDCVNCRNGKPDFCETGAYVERGIKGMHGFLSEYYVEDARYLVKVSSSMLTLGVLAEPQSIVEKVWDEVQRIQQRLIWQPKTAVVLGSGPLGLLAALTCRTLGLDTYVWSKSPADSAAADIVRACGAHYKQASGASSTEAAMFGHRATVGDERQSEESEKPISPLDAFLKGHGKRADLILECTGYSPLAFDAMTALGPNGVLALLGVTPGNRREKVSVDRINHELVLENKCVLGSVNASRKDFETGLYRLGRMESLFPGVLDRLLTDRLTMEQVAQLDFSGIGVKAVVDVIPQSEWTRLAAASEGEVAYSFSV